MLHAEIPCLFFSSRSSQSTIEQFEPKHRFHSADFPLLSCGGFHGISGGHWQLDPVGSWIPSPGSAGSVLFCLQFQHGGQLPGSSFGNFELLRRLDLATQLQRFSTSSKDQWSFTKMKGTSKISSKSFDHVIVLKPLLTWGSPI